jgi:hypothetical protein
MAKPNSYSKTVLHLAWGGHRDVLFGQHRPAAVRYAANQPIGLQRIGEPGFGPTGLYTGANCPNIYLLAVLIEKGQFPPRLGQSPVQIANLACAGSYHGSKITRLGQTGKASAFSGLIHRPIRKKR